MDRRRNTLVTSRTRGYLRHHDFYHCFYFISLWNQKCQTHAILFTWFVVYNPIIHTYVLSLQLLRNRICAVQRIVWVYWNPANPNVICLVKCDYSAFRLRVEREYSCFGSEEEKSIGVNRCFFRCKGAKVQRCKGAKSQVDALNGIEEFY